jgi:hypothetical protein
MLCRRGLGITLGVLDYRQEPLHLSSHVEAGRDGSWMTAESPNSHSVAVGRLFNPGLIHDQPTGLCLIHTVNGPSHEQHTHVPEGSKHLFDTANDTTIVYNKISC